MVSHKFTAYLPFFELFLAQEIAILSKGHKTDNSEPQNPLKHSFTNIGGLSLDFVECKSFLESNSLDIHSPDAQCETNLNASIWWNASISSNIDEVLLINPSANVFVFGNFNIHHNDRLTNSEGTDRPGEPCHR